MRRSNFILSAFLALPGLAYAKSLISKKVTAKNPSVAGFFIKANETRFDGQQRSMQNDLLRCVISSDDSQTGLLFGTTMPGALQEKGGPPLHIHKDQDEIFFVVSGKFLIQIDDHIYAANTDDAAFIPRGTKHTFVNPVENNPGTLVSIHLPGSKEMEGYFKTIASGKFPESSDADLSEVGAPIKVD
ncbi:cupin domain-containing protein [Dyadobacter sp. CY347]|uniref:cupin domain-containing protein n=1 Tax=Dyadobacter sp. CY347 TaxID=2909336 RepID=UPI001F303F63|nr:cupin domain-containing protein [Dyadobacter sp. CY347]MCF2488048.1 cupin domain-containing protein [Dyadobacter sp. CY347]